uniref:HMG box domain-containing protein n=1 Tax=Odontella aurita TaxID=265563 RepID=A0A7S4IY58_9STRA|mmetsp:Transcript_32620/g.97445  ORF Transcript_32620/g.97445 Transcript_32620/m.97445 type:complete len:144 (+) Transcript_32620:258-689(+)|eukprot:CAMPEP_0113543110 /NCGR_PEP_ID=MMETSP0015_2-20120614/9982_1 /TAXON_ID=2838 /ORGANISM="Odontella" /LENGTH=143 /DNA_ID=CAMNT_0000443245 /DNA_START=231 /DNA_END=662 /DNA_ORIENTATION=+ /assembly_acc=CAM_ASM_000160
MSATAAFIAFLQCEAKLAEDRAKALRTTAFIIEAKERKKRRLVSRPKKHTAFTLFVQENFEQIKNSAESASLESKDIIAIVAKQWAEMGLEEKQAWKERAASIKDADPNISQELIDIYVDYVDDPGEENARPKKKVAKKSVKA